MDCALVTNNEAQQQVPVVDFALISHAHEGETRKLVAAAKEWGFLQIINHGVSPRLLAEMEDQVCHAFALPLEAKLRAEPAAQSNHGYLSKSISRKNGHALTLSESFRLPLNADRRADVINKLWPEGNEHFSSVSGEYIAAVEAILLELLKSLAWGLGLDPLQFTRGLSKDGSSSVLRMNFYDSSPEPAMPTLAFPAHSDPQVLTILQHNGVGGLQILKDGKWIAVRSHPGAFLVNVGDSLRVMSNDVYRSVIHRVVMKSEQFRVSLAFALALGPQTTIEAVSQLVTDQKPSKYRPFTPEEYFEVIKVHGFSGKSHLEKFRHVQASACA